MTIRDAILVVLGEIQYECDLQCGKCGALGPFIVVGAELCCACGASFILGVDFKEVKK